MAALIVPLVDVIPHLAARGALLGLDLGSKTIGVAVSDPKGSMALPQTSLDGTKPREAIASIAVLVARERIGLVVVGLRVLLDGSTGKAAREAERFAARLRRSVAVPVECWDERFTTHEAEQIHRSSGRAHRARDGSVDATAAALMLQSYLDAHTPEGERGE